MNKVLEEIKKIGIVPVVVLDDAKDAEPLAKALCEGGLPCAEVTFRTEAAEESIRIISEKYPEMLVGAGTVLTTEQVDRAVAAGAKFIVSPGFNPKVVKYCIDRDIPVTPGTQTPSEMEQAIEMGISALVKQDVEKAEQAIKFDVEVDEQEKTIESLCMKLLLQQQPVAKDLRLISAALKMITDMERIGDHAADISEMTILMADSDYEKSAINMEVIKEMAKETTDMVIKSVDAFVNKDLELARWVINRDDVVDDLFDSFRKELIQKINENVKNGEMATDMLMVAKYFERIGDHATNIAEWVIYSITGKHEDE